MIDRNLKAENNPEEFNSSPCLGTRLCAQFPQIISKAPLRQLMNANMKKIIAL